MKRIIQRTAAIVVGLMLGVGAWAGLETVTHISDLNSSWPLGSDIASTSDDHIRNIKVALKTDFPNINAAVTGTPTQLNNLTTNVTFTGTVLGAPGFTVSGSTVPANGIYLPSANTLGFASNTLARGSINSTGNWSISAPSSGNALAVTALSGAYAGLFSGAGSDAGRIGVKDGNAGTREWQMRSGGAGTGIFDLFDGTAAASRVQIGTAGGVTVNQPTAVTAFQVNGASGTLVANFTGASSDAARIGFTDGQSGTRSWQIRDGGVAAGTYDIFDATQNASKLQIAGGATNQITGLGPTAAAQVDMTPDKGTFTITYTGMTAGVTGTASWARMGNVVVLTLPLATGTSNLSTFTATGLPAAIQPASLTQQVAVANCENTGTVGAVCQAQINSASGTITMLLAGASGGWTNSGVKGIAAASSVTYSLL